MFGLEILAKLFKILRAEDTPNQIASGFFLGMIIGLTPFLTVHNMIIILLIFIFKVNAGSALFAVALFSGFAYILDPIFHSFGYYILVDMTSLHGFLVTLFNIPIVALSRYNNTVVMGSLLVSILLILPVFFFMKYFVKYYREHIDAKLQKLKIVQIVKGSKFYKIYEKIRGVTA
ncbi:MAG: TIGR03546 family protein [Calditrichaceae bacterium]|nr:TIGR03546 family protein [Calditrichaceae bacterium]